MQQSNQLGMCGAVLLAGCLMGYALYELVLYPNAGLPTRHFAVIVAGATFVTQTQFQITTGDIP